MIYRGRIDDRFVAFGQVRPAATRHDIRDVLQTTVDGNPPEETLTQRAIGCFIQDAQDAE